MKKVLFVITKATWGGAQHYVYDLATHLSTPEFAVAVAYGEPGRLAEKLSAQGVKTIHLPSLGRDVAFLSDAKSFFELYSCIRRERPDVIHLNSSKAAALGALAARLCGVPKIIFTVHGWPFKENRSVPARAAIRAISWFTAILSHEVIVVSKEDEELGKKMTGIEQKIRYIPLGIDPPQFLSREEASAKFGISSAALRIVTIAELTPNKGLRYAIEAVALLKQRGIHVSYFLIGDGEQRGVLEQLARERSVADRVHVLGFIPDAASYLRAFDVFLLPSVKEGTPYVLLEAASAGLPTIATSVVDASFASTRISPADSGALADALATLSAAAPVANVPALSEMTKRTSALY